MADLLPTLSNWNGGNDCKSICGHSTEQGQARLVLEALGVYQGLFPHLFQLLKYHRIDISQHTQALRFALAPSGLAEPNIMPVYPLIIAQYDLSGHRYRSEHWSLAVLESKQKAHIFQLVGNADTYAYEASTEDSFESGSQTLCGGCLVGHVESAQLEWMRMKLKEILVLRGKPEDFDCQTWAIDALRMVRYANQTGIDIIEISTRKIKAEMLAEKERWETGQETLEDRLFQ